MSDQEVDFKNMGGWCGEACKCVGRPELFSGGRKMVYFSTVYCKKE